MTEQQRLDNLAKAVWRFQIADDELTFAKRTGDPAKLSKAEMKHERAKQKLFEIAAP